MSISAVNFGTYAPAGVNTAQANEDDLLNNREIAELRQIRQQVAGLPFLNAKLPSPGELGEEGGFFKRLTGNPTTWRVVQGLGTAVAIGLAMTPATLPLALVLGAAIGGVTEPLVKNAQARREGAEYTLNDGLKDAAKGAAIGALTVGIGTVISRAAGWVMGRATGHISNCASKCVYYTGGQATVVAGHVLGRSAGPGGTPGGSSPFRRGGGRA